MRPFKIGNTTLDLDKIKGMNKGDFSKRFAHAFKNPGKIYDLYKDQIKPKGSSKKSIVIPEEDKKEDSSPD